MGTNHAAAWFVPIETQRLSLEEFSQAKHGAPKMTEIVTYALDDGIATLTMDDGKANAMAPAMSGALNENLDRARSRFSFNAPLIAGAMAFALPSSIVSVAIPSSRA